LAEEASPKRSVRVHTYGDDVDGAFNFEALADEIAGCRACERLVRWRESASSHPRHVGDPAKYWARPVPGFGDPNPGS